RGTFRAACRSGRYLVSHGIARRLSAHSLRSQFRASDEGGAPRHEASPQPPAPIGQELMEWLAQAPARAIHYEELVEHGGLPGIRDVSGLEAALARPQTLLAYRKVDIADLAASYAFAIARSHPFVDGNKRTSFAAMVTFLILNGRDIAIDDAVHLE